jgi:hypothetical protein
MVSGLSGCSGSSGTEVTGTVRFEGKPLPGGKVTFFHPYYPGRNVTAYIQSDGSYRIREVPSGQVKVTVVALPTRKKGKDATKVKKPQSTLPIPLKYTDPQTTDIICPVSGSTQTFDIELKS